MTPRQWITPILVLGAGIAAGRTDGYRFAPRPQLGNFTQPDGISLVSASDSAAADGSGTDKDSKAHSQRPPSGDKLNRYAKNLYQTIGDDRRLTWGIRDLAGLDDATATLLQQKIDSAYARFDEAARQGFSYSEAESDPAKGKFVYEQKPFPEAAEQIWNDLQGEMKDVAGSQACELLVSAFHAEQKFGFMGNYRYTFVYDKTENMIRVEGVDPDGKVRDSGACSYEDMPTWMRGVLPRH